jgi:hypothetical protein
MTWYENILYIFAIWLEDRAENVDKFAYWIHKRLTRKQRKYWQKKLGWKKECEKK